MSKINEIIDGLIFIKGGTKDISERETINKTCDILAKVEHWENDYKKIMAEVKKINTLDRLEEICNAERDGRLVVLPCGVDLMKIYNELTSVCEGDGVENYTNGYRWGHKNGQIELIRRILNISEGVSHKPEQALKGGAE